jgi:uncharacterized membrane protein YczE
MMDHTRGQSRVKAFALAQDGAVTVDWVALTAGIVLLSLGAAFYVGSSVPEVADKVSVYMSSVDLGD